MIENALGHLPKLELKADAVVVGSGAGGSVACLNLARAGMNVVLLEAGPQVTPAEMTRDSPKFLARYFWEGGLRMMGGKSFHPAMQGRALGGSTVVNSAIMFALPRYVKDEWQRDAGLHFLDSKQVNESYKRIFKRTSVTDTPVGVLGRRNLAARDCLELMGLKSRPLPRAVKNCQGANDCLTGCANGNKQSLDRAYIEEAANKHGAQVFTHCHVKKVHTRGKKATGVSGHIVNVQGVKQGTFHVEADLVLMAAGPTHTPVILQQSKINPGKKVGATLFTHIGGGAIGIMEYKTDPWIGATQGWGAFDNRMQGMKYESLWGPSPLIFTKFGGIADQFYDRLEDLSHAVVMAALYRAKVYGSVKARANGMPKMTLTIPDSEVHKSMIGVKLICDGLLRAGAKYVFTGVRKAKTDLRSEEDTTALLNPGITARDYNMTLNHIFGSCRMGADGSEFPVDLEGRLRGLENLYVCDASLFPSPSGVNPQATIMALSDIISRRLADFTDSNYLISS